MCSVAGRGGYKSRSKVAVNVLNFFKIKSCVKVKYLLKTAKCPGIPVFFQVYPGITGFEPWFSSLVGGVAHFSRFAPDRPSEHFSSFALKVSYFSTSTPGCASARKVTKAGFSSPPSLSLK